MTLNTEYTADQYSGDGTTVTFTISFVFFNDEDIKVEVTDSGGVTTDETPNVTVSGGDGSTGSVTFGVAPATGDVVTITRNIERTQKDDYVNNEKLLADNLERALDRITAMIQEADDGVARSIKYPQTVSDISNVTLPAPLDGASILFDGTDGKFKIGPTADNIENAQSFADAAEAARDAAEAILDEFDDRSLGAKATDPTVDNDGDPLEAGTYYFNTTNDVVKVYNGSTWQSVTFPVGTADIVDDAVTAAKMADDAVTTAKIVDDSVTEAKVADNAVTTAKIVDDAVTAAKMNNVAYNKNFLHLQDQKPSGTDGGSALVGDQTRDINTVVTNTITGASLATNQITLPAGTYYIDASAPAYRVGRNKIKLYNSTDSADELNGQSSFARNIDDGQTTIFLSGVFTISAEKDFEIHHYCDLASSSAGLGVAVSDGTEIYIDVKIWKVA